LNRCAATNVTIKEEEEEKHGDLLSPPFANQDDDYSKQSSSPETPGRPITVSLLPRAALITEKKVAQVHSPLNLQPVKLKEPYMNHLLTPIKVDRSSIVKK
jgi:hypothetical protein